MVQPFPLYDRLVGKVKDGVFSTNHQKISLILNEAPKEHGEIILALIYHHSLVEGKGLTFQKNPYSGMTLPGGKGFVCKIQSLPPFLQHIIDAYLMEIVNS